MLRRAARRVLPKRETGWHGLQNFAVAEADSAVSLTVAGAQPADTIDWKTWREQIAHKDVVDALKSFHETQSALLAEALKADHAGAVAANTAGWKLFDSAVESCEQSVKASEKIP